MTGVSILIPFEAADAALAWGNAEALSSDGHSIVLAGPTAQGMPDRAGVRRVAADGGKGVSLRAGLSHVASDITVITDPHDPDASPDVSQLVEPIAVNKADAVFGRRASEPTPRISRWMDRAVSSLASWVAQVDLSDPMSAHRAFRTRALSGLNLARDDEGIDAEILVKLAAQHFRILEVPLSHSGRAAGWGSALKQVQTLLRYAAVQNDSDNLHEGYNTLERMDSAHNYNAWVGRRLKPFLGNRVLEVGAGIGTITREIQEGLELLIALEVDAFYVERLQNIFRDSPHVRPYLSGVELADWQRLRSENVDTVVLTNVLEHIEDDAAALRNFREVLGPGGHLLVWVPALPALMGTMDQAVGHHRRYSRDGLHRLLESNGFSVEHLEWVNLLGIPGWYANSVLFRRRAVPPLQLRLYDAVAPWLARLESQVRLPVGLSLFAVARTIQP